MLDFSKLDAIQFVDKSSNSNTTRVSYQNEDHTIRESCYDDQRKWFTTGDIISNNDDVKLKPKALSPIAVTRWNDGVELHFRVYYVNTSDEIIERVGTSLADGRTTWTDGGDLTSAELAPTSQLGFARPGQDSSELRVYYQDRTTNNIREITYFESRGHWSVSSETFEEARAGTSISAVSAKPPGDVRVYFQDKTNNNLREWYMDSEKETNQSPWSSSRIGNYTLEPGVPISAICWYDDMRNPEKPKGLHISVFTRTNKYPEAVSRISYSPHQGWDATTDLVATIYRTSTGVSAIGACQVSENKKGAISVFYQPEAQVIDLKPVAIGAARVRQAEIAAVVLPKGIPTVR